MDAQTDAAVGERDRSVRFDEVQRAAEKGSKGRGQRLKDSALV